MYLPSNNNKKENHYYNFYIVKKKKFFTIYPPKKEKIIDTLSYKDYDKLQLCDHCKEFIKLEKNNINSCEKKNNLSFILKDFNIPGSNDKHYININATLPFRPNNINIEEPIYENIEVFNQAKLNVINSAKAKCKKLSNYTTSIPSKGVSNQYLRSYNPYMPMCTPIIIPSSNTTNEANKNAKNLKQWKREERIKRRNRYN
ncbi:Hypothetical protein SRAE_X000122100 [Strongyloides ratti]|uniref:Uncharacterized protein n=1 Tax=Strongyloides ratti TaxID=34506 RepID=A0A090KPF9_STRRB|nr:Hypothetical protein SRAE_X000122100 [Strongyloides ratti]CEF59473.1 Hypothetical protein SRAE_X000122100 [Strongyloides ratti]